MTSTAQQRYLMQMLDVGRDVADTAELTLLAGAVLLLETAARSKHLTEFLGLGEQDSLQRLPVTLEYVHGQRYQALTNRLRSVLAHPGIEKVQKDMHFLTAQALQDFSKETVWTDAGELFTALLDKAADPKLGSFQLAETASRLLAGALKCRPGMRVLDPTARSGELLVAVGKRMREQGIEEKDIILHGYEPHQLSAAIAQLNLLLNRLPQAELTWADARTTPNLPTGVYDAVLSMPPFGVSRAAVAEQDHDPRLYRMPKTGRPRLESIYLQIGLAALRPGGRAAFLMPASMLFLRGTEAHLRMTLTEEGIATAAVHLPTGLLTGTAVSTALLVFDQPEHGEKSAQSVRLIDAEQIGARQRVQRLFSDADLKAILRAIDGEPQDTLEVCDITLSEQAEKDYSWQLSSYQKREIQVQSLSDIHRQLPDALQSVKEAEQKVARAMAELERQLDGRGRK